ncbi:MAG: MFS transporter [Lacipirellulaceae bacterium]
MTETQHHATAPEDRIPLGQKSAYAVGMLVNNLQAAALPAMMVILNIGLGMSPILVGIIGFVPRIFDAVSDPLMGYISDRTRTRWGRRRPFIFIGALLAGVIFAAMWQMPSGQSETFYYRTFLTASIAYFLIYTIYATPFVALGFEMTPDYHERTRLQAFANTFGQLAWLGAPAIWWFIANKDFFPDEAAGARYLAIWIGGAISLLGIAPAIFCRERQTLAPSTDDSDETEGGVLNELFLFFRGVATTFRCGPFVKLCLATFLVFNGFMLGTSFSLYVMIYYVFQQPDTVEGINSIAASINPLSGYALNSFDLDSAKSSAGGLNFWFGFLTSVATLLVIPFTGYLSTIIGKRKTFLITIPLSLVGYGLKWFGYNTLHPYWLLAACPFVAFGTGSLFTLMGSMVADVCDYDELDSHQRREGMFGAIYWWMVKVGLALAGLLTGVLLEVSGFDVNRGILQTEETLLLLRVFDVGVPLITSAIAIAIMMTYELTETRSHEIREELIRRRGKLSA